MEIAREIDSKYYGNLVMGQCHKMSPAATICLYTNPNGLPGMDLQEDEAMDGMAADDASPASAVRERYERMFKEKQRGGSKGLAGGALSGDPAAAALAAQGQAVRTAFQGSISAVFTKHLR